jgi:outer membrane protein assembly factor BamB
MRDPDLSRSPSLVCLDRETGRELWRVANVYGEPCVSDSRVVVYADTATTSMLEMATGGKGVSVVRQFDVDDGGELYSRQSDVGLSFPVLAGDRLIGVWFERREQGGAMNGGFCDSDGTDSGILGVVAFCVK